MSKVCETCKKRDECGSMSMEDYDFEYENMVTCEEGEEEEEWFWDKREAEFETTLVLKKKGCAVKGKVIQYRKGTKVSPEGKEVEINDWLPDEQMVFGGFGVIRWTGRGPMFDFTFEVDGRAEDFECVKKFIEAGCRYYEDKAEELVFKYAIERRKSLEEFTTEEWQPLLNITIKHIEADRADYYVMERMLKTAKAEAKKGKYELKKEKGRYLIRKLR